MPFNPVNPRVSFPEIEKEILNYWKENAIFQKSLDKPAPQGEFVFYEGPPTANGMPGIHHVIARAFKDAIPRYKTMRGYHVTRQAGWDTHGLPVELQVEKELGISGKQQIESIKGTPQESIAEFNRLCRESVWKYKAEWEELTQRMGYWLDLEHPYITYENSYIESVWGIIKKLDEKKLLYKGHKVVPYCWSCGTALSSHEVAQGYKDTADISPYVRFEVVPGQSIDGWSVPEKTYLVAWTTTPWTLPANVALAIDPDLTYYIIEAWGMYHISAIDIYGIDIQQAKQIKEIKGSVLIGLHYQPLFPEFYDSLMSQDESKVPKSAKEAWSRAYKTYPGKFIDEITGTGIVHIAPAFGEDDLELANTFGLPVFFTIDKNGKFLPFITQWAGKTAINQSENIIQYLEEKRLIVNKLTYKHSYPHCWRCDHKLIYYAKDSWFIAMSTLRDELKKNNESINWVPDHLKDGRFGEWLENVKDWNLSRDRYWGTPLPIWEAEDGSYITIGSRPELEQLAVNQQQPLSDLHKPFIDEVIFEKDGKTYRRTPEVMDVWFDSGVMPYAQGRSQIENLKSKIEKPELFPADFISEAIDQTRGWFYTLHAISTALGFGPAYKNVISIGHILDTKGQKMSKSKGNVLDPIAIGDAHGFDAMRWYMYTVNQPGETKRVGEEDIREQVRKLLLTLWNTYAYFVTYANMAKFEPEQSAITNQQSSNLFDQWLVSKKHNLIKKVTEDLDAYNLFTATRAIQDFVAELSTWYVRLNKDRAGEREFLQTLYDTLLDLSKLLAPFTPFITEEIYRGLTGGESVHLETWPTINTDSIHSAIEGDMEIVQKLTELGHAQRKEQKIRVRQPLAHAAITLTDERMIPAIFSDIIKAELNVRQLTLHTQQSELSLTLDTTLTPELIAEGIRNDLVRLIQDTRKDAQYAFDELVSAALITDNAEIKQAANKHIEDIKSAAHVRDLSFQALEYPDAQKEGKIGEGILATVMVKK